MVLASARVAHALPDNVAPHVSYRLRPSADRAHETCERSVPMQLRKLKYHVSVSVDGYILSRGDGFDAFPQGDDPAQYLQSLHAYGIALMGRRTYEAGLQAGIVDPYPHLMSYVFSRTLRARGDSQVELVSDDAVEWVRRLKACPGKDLYLCGGAQLAASLFKANLVDEMILKVNPVLRGTGRRLLSELDTDIELVRESSMAYGDGVVMLAYRVQKNGAASPHAK